MAMTCLNCDNDAAPDNALCSECFDRAAQGRQSIRNLREEITFVQGRPKQDTSSGRLPNHGLRLLACLCDFTILSVFSTGLFYILAYVFGLDLVKLARLKQLGSSNGVIGATKLVELASLVSAISYLVPGWLYYIFSECSHFQGTLGKKLVGLSVTSGGSTIGVDTSTKRFALKFAASIVPYVVLPLISAGCIVSILFLPFVIIVMIATGLFMVVNPFFVFFTSRRQALHDLLAGTEVTRERDTGWKGILFCCGMIIGAFALQIGFSFLAPH